MCDERERLIGYLYDECDADERRQIETHLESCSTCRAEIGGLQSVRTDLLAWSVPEHSPVWRPMPAAVAPPVVWWRQSPGWALAAAATVVLAAGIAGGAATRLMAPPAPPQVAGVTADELNAVQRQIVSMLRAELDRVQAASAAGTTATPPAGETLAAADITSQVERRINAKLDANGRETVDLLVDLHNMVQKSRENWDREAQRMKLQIEALQLAVEQKGGGR